MSDFLTLLAARALGADGGVRPRPVSRFETGQAGEVLEGGFQILAQPVSSELAGMQVETPTPERRPAEAASSACGAIEREEAPREKDHIQPPEPPAEQSQPEPAVELVTLETPPAIEFHETVEPLRAVRVEQTAQHSEKPLENEPRGTPAGLAPAPQGNARAARVLAVRASATVKYQREPETGESPPSPGAETVRVTIGRVDVKAVFGQRGVKPSGEPRPAGPLLSLDDYLRQRGGGRR